MFKLILLTLTLTLTLCTIQKGYTITNLKQYTNDHFGANDNSTHVIIGTYLTGKGNVDALKILESPYSFNINTNEALRGKTKYFKVFGSEENYQTLVLVDANGAANGVKNNGQLKSEGSFVVIDWDYKLNNGSGDSPFTWLQKFLFNLPNAFLKIPAHLLCQKVGSVELHKFLNHKNFIVEMYGQENPYLTYDSIFAKKTYTAENGYTPECPKNPSTAKLQEILGTAKFHIEKSLHSEYRGYVGEMVEWIKEAEANNNFAGVVFFDGHPRNIIRL